MEDGWRAGIEGNWFGTGTIVTAAAARFVMLGPEYPLYISLARAAAASRYAIEAGAVPQGDELQIEEQGVLGRLLHRSPFKNDQGMQPDAAFAYYTAYPHQVFFDSRIRRDATSSDLLGDAAGPTLEYMKVKAFEVEGPGKALAGVPQACYGKYVTVDRQEIERINAVRSLIHQYRANRSDNRPLSIAVFGQPGSGKSFAIKQLGISLFGEKNPVLKFNLSQFTGDGLYQLHQAFHRVRDAAIKGTIPLVFWDEFDADDLQWLKHFLAPMQDAEFRSGSDVHAFGKAIFVFAGGTKHSFADFDRSAAVDDAVAAGFRDRKGPDFVSRLRGYIDIKGPNPQGNQPQQDPAYVIRRAMIVRSTLEQVYGRLIDPQSNRCRIDPAVVYGFLNADKFIHGARSIQSLLSMCRLQGATEFGVARLNKSDLPTMHVTADFFEHVRQAGFDDRQLTALSEALHEGWRKARVAQGWIRGTPRDDVQMRHPSLCSFHELGPEGQACNHAVARAMPAKLHDVGCFIVRQTPNGAGRADQLPESIQEKLARYEHDRWLRERLLEGYEFAPETKEELRQHRDVTAFDRLRPEERELDLVVVRVLPEILAKYDLAFERRVAGPQRRSRRNV